MNLRYRWHGSADTTFVESMIRDDLGRITTLSDQVSADSLRTYLYIYTTAGRLKAVDRLIGQTTLHLQRYDYDANGNRTAFLGANVGDTATANYDAQDRMLRYKDTAYSYTKNGELTQAVSPTGTSTYTYDELGNLITAHPAGGPTIQYLIDGQNRRVSKKLGSTLQKIWLYQNGLNVVAELDVPTGTLSRFVYGSRANVPDYMVQGSATYRIISDQLGSVRRVVNAATGEMKQRLEYDAWGNVVVDSNPGFQPFEFAGGLYDPDTKLVRFGARDYDPSVGRWTCKDPIPYLDSAPSSYAYAAADPVNLIDQEGLQPTPPGASALPPAPTGTSINANICEALRHKGDLVWFYNMVHSKAPWDYKYKNGKPFEAFGNANYGATAAALGVSDEWAKRLAGLYQIKSGTSRLAFIMPGGGAYPMPGAPMLVPPPLVLPPYGDDPADQRAIAAGQAYFHAHEEELACGCQPAKP